ncbi:PREDICTED: pectin acetylesterase 8-like [Ipomoea nil]|uniref:pectin acetylesterase 8-like n=1 Tax=Ipomoea nil TaxID=35883 RepID=UPI000900D4B5|nr:PREDICTED: pectin acetylesterase 8-like [Ipomoea nil]
METKPFILFLFFFVIFQLTTSNGLFVNPTLVKSDTQAVCLTGKPASYYFFQGFGNGINNWIVYLPGGAWCHTAEYCIKYANNRKITQDPRPFDFGNILDSDKEKNPDFFDWNKVVITYCDGSSFTGDSQTIYNGTNLYFRGARIFNAVMQELIQKGMGMAQNALLFGSSAGGVAATLHCDGFHNLLPYAIRVKCLSDAGYFFPSKRFEDQRNDFIPTFQGLITLHGSAKSLPKMCTSRLSSYMCFFAQNVQKDIQTPIFFLMSAFDSVQVSWTFKNNEAIKKCIMDQTGCSSCSSEMYKVLQDLRLEFLSLLPKHTNCSSKGVLITSPKTHEQERNSHWNSDMVVEGSNETIVNLFRDWYFDKRGVYIIDKYPYPCLNNYSTVPNNSFT